MFDSYCSVCAQRMLIFPSQITTVATTEDGIVVGFTCWCGTEQSQVSGRRAGRRQQDAVAA